MTGLTARHVAVDLSEWELSTLLGAVQEAIAAYDRIGRKRGGQDEGEGLTTREQFLREACVQLGTRLARTYDELTRQKEPF